MLLPVVNETYSDSVLLICSNNIKAMSVPNHMTDFVTAMQQVYHFPMVIDDKIDWKPPPLTDGHRGRHLWTDAFGVFNFITLSKETSQPHYLNLAATLVETVHDVLGRTRDLSARLPGATNASPLAGGLRIGKEAAIGTDQDGQYHHYLTLWMMALNRLSIASGDRKYNDQAVSLAKAIHPAFVHQRETSLPRVVWKMSTDLSQRLSCSEGQQDPLAGYVVYSIIQHTSGNPDILKTEIDNYKLIIDKKWPGYTSSDTLDLGMTLWYAHWCAGRDELVNKLTTAAIRDMRILFHETRYLALPIDHRLAFREFATCLGINVWPVPDLRPVARQIIRAWEAAGRVPVPKQNTGMESLESIDLVMYAAALHSGALKRNYLDL